MLKLRHLILSLILLALILVGSGCKSTGRYVHWYEGPILETNKVALLKVQKDILSGNRAVLTVDKIDGKSLTQGKFMGNNAEKIELLSGSHELWVSYRQGDRHSLADAQINFTAEAGKTYNLLGVQKERGFGKAFWQDLTMQHWYWTLWIIDEETKKVVAGNPREAALRWWE